MACIQTSCDAYLLFFVLWKENTGLLLLAEDAIPSIRMEGVPVSVLAEGSAHAKYPIGALFFLY